MGAGLVAGGVSDGVAPGQAAVVEHLAAAGVALGVADGHAALEVVDELAVPGAPAEIVRPVVKGGEHGDAVDEAVDGAPLPADDVVDSQPVHGHGLGHVGRPLSAGGVGLKAAAGGFVNKVDPGPGRAVGAVADDLARRLAIRVDGEDLEAVILVVDQGLAQAVALDGTDEGVLVRAGEDRAGDGVVGQG